MSEEAFKIYEEALKGQHNRNEARRIRTLVTEARRNPHPAGLRWPFELLQNALDAGPRTGRPYITIHLRYEKSKVVFEHDGAMFTSDELAALLSGGSSKEFESATTTGRFGTGFLVTHVLAERTNLRGLLKVPTGCEQFSLILDRGGDEDAILENIGSCNEAIRAAELVTDSDTIPSAIFEYPIVENSTIAVGFEALKRSLPYLYATRPSLGRVELIPQDGITEVWTPQEVVRQPIKEGYVEQRSLWVEQNGSPSREIRIYRFMTDKDAPASALVQLERTDDVWKVQPPEPDAPRVYREYPLRGSGFLPINLVLDGKFDPDQERRKLLMSDRDKELLENTFAAAVVAVKHAFDQKWKDAHLLAQAWKPSTAFDPTDAIEKQWWTEQLTWFAEQLARLAIVECTEYILPALVSEDSDDSYADFIVPRLLPTSGENETTVERMWPLVESATELDPPRKELAIHWTDIAEGWHSLGVQVSRISVKDLAESVRQDAETLDQLNVTGDHKRWLASFLDIVGECWNKRSGIDPSVLTGMLPNQNQHLCSPTELSRDAGVSDVLKDICAEMDHDVRSQILLAGFENIAEEAGLDYLSYAIESAISTSVSEDNVIEEVVNYLEDKLPEDEDCDLESGYLQKGSVKIISYIWEARQKEAASIARRLPLITSKQRAVRWSQDRMMMAPVSSWHESAQAFAYAYPPQRVLADLYAGSQNGEIPSCVPALVQWGIAIADPITKDTPAELKERRLAAISPVNTDGVTISREEFSQIALLQPEMLNRCQEGIEEARALLGLVLCHVALHDPMWQEVRIVKGRKSGEDVDIPVRGALWLADLKFRAWVPIPGEDGKPVKMVANATTLKELLDPAWLVGNDAAIGLLSEWFEFDELELRLLGIAPDAGKRKELRTSLAKLVESGGPDPEFYASLIEVVEAQRRRSRDVGRARRLGIAVQEAIKSAMESYNLKLKLIDRGFDYEVTLSTDDVLEDAATRFEVGPYLLEVKATTRGEARLTPMQANMASKDPSVYVLCIVDLRCLSDEDLDAEWTATRVEPLAKIIPDIGNKVEETCLLVEAAKTRSVAIRNDSALRYEVPLSVLEAGISISTWVKSISNDLLKKVIE